MNDTPAPFAPFVPNSPPVQPEAEKPAKQSRKKKSETTPETPAEQPRQRRKKSSDEKPSLKFDLQTILAAAAMLNPDDQAAFEKLVGILSGAGKPGRERLLAAIGKIFE